MFILNGKKISAQIRQDIKKQVTAMANKPGLAVILVGNDPASHLYVSLKERACLEARIYFEKYLFSAETTDEKIIEKIDELNNRSNISGILVQLPLPNQNTDKIIAAIDPDKDVDGFHPENLRRLENNQPCLLSPVVLGVKKLLEETGEPLANKKAVLIMSKIFAKPFVLVLKHLGVESEIVSADDPKISEKTKSGDLLIVAVGKPKLITGSTIKPGAIVIDIGTTRVGEKVVGDVGGDSVEALAGWFTPVPGGVGPMTVAMLLWNVLNASRLHTPLPTVLKN
jgi:methylenetetrahydrofolate dehydrogenase (NADP+)/methenyltetrahydrofolate cyclohydrolase